MKNLTCKALVLSFFALFLASCTTTTGGQATAPAETTTADTGTTGVVEPTGPTAEEIALQQDQAFTANRTIYFDLDKYDLKAEYRELIEAHAKFLAKNPAVNVKLEGHADERGTPEYNIALGEKRAKALADMFRSFGVSNSQIEVVSYGEERPVADGHNDEAWAKNRRVEIKYNL